MANIINLSSDEDSQSTSEEIPNIALLDKCGKKQDEDVLDLTLDSSSLSSVNLPNSDENDKPKKRKQIGIKKQNKKSGAHLSKEEKKRKLAEKRNAKRNADDMNNIYKPGECMRHMNIELHKALLDAWYMGNLQLEISSTGAKLLLMPSICDPGLIMWSRSMPLTFMRIDGQLKLGPSKKTCNRALYIKTLEEVAEHIISRMLSHHMVQVRELSDCDITLVIFGVKDYFKSLGRKKHRWTNIITEIELEMAITDLLVTANCDTVCVNTPNEMAFLIAQQTKAIAEEPYKKSKRECEEQAEYYMKGDNKKCVEVDNNGNGVARLWQQMLAILPTSSLETSRAICAKYKTPLALYEAVHMPNGVTELADVGVSRAAVPGSKPRRVGPEFARKLHTLFTAEDGNMLLD